MSFFLGTYVKVYGQGPESVTLSPELLAGSLDGVYVGRNFARDPDESSGTELTNSSKERAGERQSVGCSPDLRLS